MKTSTEYLAMRWRDVDLDGAGLRVTQNVHRIRQDEPTDHMGQRMYGFRFGAAKTHRSKRPGPYPPWWSSCSACTGSQQVAVRLQAGAVWTDLDLVFTDARRVPAQS